VKAQANNNVLYFMRMSHTGNYCNKLKLAHTMMRFGVACKQQQTNCTQKRY